MNIEPEEVLLISRWIPARRVSFKYGLGEQFIGVLKTLQNLGLDRTNKVAVDGVEVSPRDLVAACLPIVCGGPLGLLGPLLHRSALRSRSTEPSQWNSSAQACGPAWACSAPRPLTLSHSWMY